MTQQYRLVSMAAWLSSTGISPHNLLRHIPSIHLSIVNSIPCPDCSTIPKLQLPATATSRVCMSAERTDRFSFHSGCHRSAVSLSALNVSPLTQTVAPMWGWTPAPVFPPAKVRSVINNISVQFSRSVVSDSLRPHEL